MVLSKLAPLAFDHEHRGSASNKTMGTPTITPDAPSNSNNRWVRIYLSILLLLPLHLLLRLQLHPNLLSLFVLLNSLSTTTTTTTTTTPTRLISTNFSPWRPSLQVQLEHQRVPTIMAMTIVTRRQHTRTDHGNGNHGILADEQLWPKQPAVLPNEIHNHDDPGSA